MTTPSGRSRFVQQHAALLATVPALVMVLSWIASVAGILAMHLSKTDLILWPAILAFIGSGWLLAVRRPDNAVGWLLLMTVAGLSFLPLSVLSAWLIEHHVGFGRWIAALSQVSFVLDVGGLALLLPLLFPNGRLPSRRRWWRVVLVADVLYMLLATANVFEPGRIKLPDHRQVVNPFGLPHAKSLLGVVISICIPCLMVGFAGSFSALVVRWRSAGETQRAQMKWVVLALLLAPAPFFLHDWWLAGSDVLMVVVLPLVPIAVAVSVLRYRLYEIDRVLSRTVSYLLVTGVVVGVYVTAVAVTDRVLGFSSSVAVAGSTLAAAALFRPLLVRVQRAIDRRFNRDRYDASRTIEAFAVRLRDEVDEDVVRSDLLTVAARAMQPSTMSLWVAS